MSRTYARLLIALVAAAHAAFFIVYQRPDWDTEWTDQVGYTRLGRALAQTGRFTRYPDYPTFVPEVIRTPGYPVFVAAVNRTIGEGHMRVAIAQAGVFAAICLLVYGLARMIAGDGVALAAGLATALYPPLPYYGALTLTEVFTTFLVTLAVYLWLRSLRSAGSGVGWAIGAAVIFAWAALTRPSFQHLPIFLIAAACLIAPRVARAWRRSAVLIAVFAATIAPWLLYNYAHLGMFTFTPAGGIGRTLWEGTWQIALPGRVQSMLTDIADTTPDRADLDRKVRALAGDERLDPAPMLDYVHQWQDIRRIWTEPQEPWARARARIAADGEYLRVGLENIGHNRTLHVFRRLTRGLMLLWMTEIPVRYSDINNLPPLAIRAIWLPQALLVVAAMAGLVVLWRRGAHVEAAALGATIVYVTAVHAVLYSEARYALPAKPIVLLLAVVAVWDLAVMRNRRRRSS